MNADKRKNMAIFLLPSLVILAFIVIYPLVTSLVNSFFSVTLKKPGMGEWIWFDNYAKALTSGYFLKSAWITLVFTVIVVVLEFLLGFVIALLLNREIRGKHLFFSIIMIPMLITPVAVGLIWRLLLHPDLGIVNYLLGLIGIPGQAWLGNPDLALFSVILVDIWHQVPFMVLILLAGLVSLPKEPYEAAAIDGASAAQAFWRITLPLMLPTITVALLLRAITALKTYDLIYILTKGGPGTETEVISYHIYKQAYTYLETGYSSAMSFLLLLAVLVLSVVFVKLNKQQA